MSRYRFVEPASTRCDLSDGDWVEFKNLLSFGEATKIRQAALPKLTRSEEGRPTGDIDWREYRIVRLLVWITAWSFRTRDGKKSKTISRENLEALQEDTFVEQEKALDQHVEAMEAEPARPSGDSTPETPAS